MLQKTSYLIKEIITILISDIKLEFKNKSFISSSLIFTIILTSLFSFTIGAMKVEARIISAFILITIFFISMSCLSNVWTREYDKNTIYLFKLYSNFKQIYISKLLYNIIILNLISFILILLIIFFININIIDITFFIFVIIASNIAISSISNITALISAKVKANNIIFQIISLPILFPILLLSNKILSISMLRESCFDDWKLILLLLLISFLIIVLSLILLKDIWED